MSSLAIRWRKARARSRLTSAQRQLSTSTGRAAILPRLHSDNASRRLCLESGTEYERLNSLLGMGLEPGSVVDALGSTAYHVMGGNMPVSRAAPGCEAVRF